MGDQLDQKHTPSRTNTRSSKEHVPPEQQLDQPHLQTPAPTDDELIEKMPPEQVAGILRQHRDHSVDLFNNRLNCFLVAESVLLGIVGGLYSRPATGIIFPRILVVWGLITTLVWWYVQARQKYILDKLTKELLDVDPIFRRTLRKRKEGKGRYWFSANHILTHIVPALLGLMWVILLAFLITPAERRAEMSDLSGASSEPIQAIIPVACRRTSSGNHRRSTVC